MDGYNHNSINFYYNLTLKCYVEILKYLQKVLPYENKQKKIQIELTKL